MKLPARQKKATADWQLQLINIVFLLLLFFVMNGTISNIQDASIDIPRTVELATAGTVSEAAYVSAENRLTFRGAPATAEGIASAWLEEAAGNTRPFLVVADRKLPAVQLMARLQELKKAGILSISLVTIREAADAQ